MKNNLENNFHESLKDFEMDYNPKAWESMSAKLDAVMPVKKSFTNWIVAASLILVSAVVTSLFFIPTKENKENTLITKTTNSPNSVENKSESNKSILTTTEKSETQLTKNQEEDEVRNNDVTTPSSNSQDFTQLQNPDVDTKTSVINDITETKEQESNSSNSPAATSSKSDQKVTPQEVIIPQLPSICAGETMTIKNTNDVEIIIGGPWFKQIIAPHSSTNITFKNEGTYVIGPLESDKSDHLTTFSVNSLPQAGFLVDDAIKYDKGLPTIRLVSESGQIADWKYGNVTKRGTEIHPHFFEKGNHTVEIIVNDFNGCSNSIQKDLFIEESYNLLAVNSFIPQDADARRNTFMPFALTQRKNVQFNLIVIDPSDGHTVFQTNDSTQGWTGIDQQTGQVVKFEKAYIWKVIVSNPVQGEKGEYAGTITPLTK